MTRKNVLILCGGKSDEHEISLISAKCVLDALDRNRFHPIVVGISKEGVWYLEEEKAFFTGEFRADKIRLNLAAPTVTVAPFPREGKGTLYSGGKEIPFDVVFPLLHGPFGEDGTLQGFLEILGVPYVGSNCGSSWNCMDKELTKIICQRKGINVTEFVCVTSLEELSSKSAEIRDLGNPVFVKPSRLGSSVGVTKVETPSQLLSAVKLAFRHDSKCLIERAIVGRELECAILGLNNSPKAAVPGEIIPAKRIGWYSYEAKYLLGDGAQVLAPAPLSPAVAEEVSDFSLKIFRAMECDGMARVDLFLEQPSGKLYLNEVNTIPGFTPISMYPKLWEVSGIAYRELVTELIELAFKRVAKHVATRD